MNTPDIVLSDIILGVVTFICGVKLYRHHPLASVVFVLAALSAWLGALSHAQDGIAPTGFVWALTILSMAGSATALVAFSTRKHVPAPVALLVLLGYTLFIRFSDDFLWVALLETAACTTYGISLLIHRYWSTSPVAVKYFAAYVAANIASAIIYIIILPLPLPINPATVFHLLEIPSAILMYKSVQALLVSDKPDHNPVHSRHPA